MSAIIEIENLTKTYGSRTAVNDLNLTVVEGSIFGFVGPNGAGKTTAIRVITTLLKPDHGNIKVAGYSVAENPDEVRKRIGYMPDFFGVYSDITVWEYLEFFCGCFNIPDNRRQRLIADLLLLVDLQHRQDDFVDKLSRGMKQRLSLARTLINDPKILILDEPASGLDPRARIEIRELLVELSKMGKTIFFSTHILSDVSEICTHIGIIEYGSMRASGKIEELQNFLTPNRIIKMSILGSIDKAVTILSKMDHITNIDTLSSNSNQGLSEVRFSLTGADEVLSNTLSELIMAKISVIRFGEEAKGLEDVFMRITDGLVT